MKDDSLQTLTTFPKSQQLQLIPEVYINSQKLIIRCVVQHCGFCVVHNAHVGSICVGKVHCAGFVLHTHNGRWGCGCFYVCPLGQRCPSHQTHFHSLSFVVAFHNTYVFFTLHLSLDFVLFSLITLKLESLLAIILILCRFKSRLRLGHAKASVLLPAHRNMLLNLKKYFKPNTARGMNNF